MISHEFIDTDTLIRKAALPWTEKYRPQLLNQLVAHEHISKVLRQLMNKNNFPHLLLQGPPGTGKTTTILACARQMYGDSVQSMVLELNGSDDRGINIVRNLIDHFASNNNMDTDIFNTHNKKQKLVILDEADSMTMDAQFALRNVIESNTNTTRFCLICNYSEKITKALKSRCSQFRFQPVPFEDHIKHAAEIIKYENINIDPVAVEHIVNMSMGDMRRSINILQSLTMVYREKFITLDMLYENICQPLPQDLYNIVNNIFTLKLRESFNYARNLENEKALNVNDIIDAIIKNIIKSKRYSVSKTARIITQLSEIEQNLASNTNPLIQLCGAIATIKI
jgi:replication factor C subunit 3/5